ncbi:putative RNA methylase [Chloropicon primus]|uniref:Ribosomal RNA large subunit methyltransferase K/L-like methyltransferase domain-containing protein n=1 Tax=Chloropicon primus TaxID=1764295 RepID=A0A5B8MLX9_9CHLO|nr:hypothetical protein A3770_05p37890 [Chloropicon primus]UPR00485.1 putative RNA methylase [Chloropicon primus]|mmetsp:Transcript_5890/g.17730  ORF Transcript_5890/g.17730 Transcript_5890/m.17730 type:complete len:428 (-) Transcript_5890:51-1334(-)|eukprot:QDZ21271.1 hypothetical protein A3770_05p37890 [Chloropicon primus]
MAAGEGGAPPRSSDPANQPPSDDDYYDYYATVAARSMLNVARTELRDVMGVDREAVRVAMGGKLCFRSKVPEPRGALTSLRAVERVGCLLLLRETTGKPRGETPQSLEDLRALVVGSDFKKASRLLGLLGRSSAAIKFRVTCKRSGRVLQQHSTSEIAASQGKALEATLEGLGWRASLREPDLTITVQLSDAGVLVGFDLAKQVDFSEGNISIKGLDPVVSWGVIRATNIQAGETLLDPMCGKGILLMEAFRICSGVKLVGYDVDQSMVEAATKNTGVLDGEVQIGKVDATRMPLEDQSVDVIACDLPFGFHFGSVSENKELYPRFFREMERVLKRETGRAALLTNYENHGTMLKCLEEASWLRVLAERQLLLGRQKCRIYLLCAEGGSFNVEEAKKQLFGIEEKRKGKERWSKRRRLERKGLQLLV